MEPLLIVAVVLCFVVGASLGLLGAGGSVLMVPLFVYIAKMSVNEAIAMSLVIVGSSSAVGSYKYFKQGLVNRRLVVLFAVPGIIASFFGARVARIFLPEHLLFMFGITMILIAWVLYKRSQDKVSGPEHLVCHPKFILCLSMGSVIGFLTGLLGVGGGFLIVPAIALMMRCSLYTAIGTSLAVISINSFAGFVGHLSVTPIDFRWMAIFLIITSAGAFFGAKFSQKISTVFIQRVFSGLVFFVGCVLSVQHFPFK